MTSLPPVFTPETLAEHWQCSARHIRNLVKEGRLTAFRLGGTLLRIKREAVEEFEASNIETPQGPGSQADSTQGSPPSDTQLRSDLLTRARLANLRRRQKS